MTTEAQKLALLEWAGWKRDGCESDQNRWKNETQTAIGDYPVNLSSLDVIAEFEGKLSDEQRENYVGELANAVQMKRKKNKTINSDYYCVATATAPQRLEALVRTLGLWKEFIP